MTVWRNRRLWAWAMYDFANSAFATTILSVIFNVYFVQRVVPPEGVPFLGRWIGGTALWGYTASASMLLVFLLSPLLGAMSDHAGRKKSFLAFFWTLGCLGSAGLFFVSPGEVGGGIAFFILGNTGFAGSLVFYNALLPSLADEKTLGRASGLGWAVGYLGGGLCLLVNLFMIKSPSSFGLSPDGFLPVRASFLVVATWWAVFTLPLLLWVPEPAPAPSNSSGKGSLSAGWSRLADTARHLPRYRNLGRFLAAYLIYNDGIETVILMASIVGAKLAGMSQDGLILCFLMIQGVAFVGAIVFGWGADRWGHKPMIALTLAVFGATVLWAALRLESAREFWMVGVAVGLVLGGSQAASRSLMGLLTPKDKSAEFFSFYGVVGKLTAVVGPAVFGFASDAWGLRAGMLSLLVFFLLGGILLTRVEEPRHQAI